MSAYCNLAGLFPPDVDQQFNDTILWQPIPVHTRPAKEDNVGTNCLNSGSPKREEKIGVQVPLEDCF